MKKQTYQTTYQDKIGSASLNIAQAVVGTSNSFQLTYTAGELGIDESGGIKVLFRTAGDCADVQFEDAGQPNFVTITSSNKNVEFVINAVSVGSFGKIHERPWSRGFSILVKGDFLSICETITFDFTNWRMQTFAEKEFQFKVVVDPFATGRYLDLLSSPKIKLVADEIDRLVAIVPSISSVQKNVSLFVKAEDKWGNPVLNCNQKITVQLASFSTAKIKFQSKVKLKNGVARVFYEALTEGNYCIKADFQSITAYSNPGLIKVHVTDKYYWADWHGQSEETIGTHTVFDYMEFAKKYAAVDITSLQGNDFQIATKFWKSINKTTKHLNEDGTFIAFPGYEWSGNTNKGGDRNILYLGEGEKIHRSSHALLDDYSDITTDAHSVSDLFTKLDPKRTIVIPHVGGRYSDLNIHDPALEPVVEIHSTWGTFEWFYQEALEKGYQVGVVANSDDHTGRMGASYPAYAHFNSYGGLTAVLAKELSRTEIFSAIKKRHCYATTGARIFIDMQFTNNKGKQVGMGDTLTSNAKPVQVVATCRGTDAIEKIELYRGSTLITAQYPQEEIQTSFLKIIYKGSACKGRARAFKWSGSLELENVSIQSVERINFYNKKNYIISKEKKLTWEGVTTGGVQGFILSLDSLQGTARMNINGKKISFDLHKLSHIPVTHSMGGLDGELSYYLSTEPQIDSACNFSYTIDQLTEKQMPLYIKVTQRDGHMAWTSPVFVR